MHKKVFVNNSSIFNNQLVSKETNSINVNQSQINFNDKVLNKSLKKQNKQNKIKK